MIVEHERESLLSVAQALTSSFVKSSHDVEMARQGHITEGRSYLLPRHIPNTNILVDDFDFCKGFPKGTFHHFLTHYHSDHYAGLSPNWNYGYIHCTPTTQQYLEKYYPKVNRVIAHEYGQPDTIILNPEEPDLKVQFVFIDAQHMPGSAMILFSGFMGTILFTGDFRYSHQMVINNPVLFPPARRQNKVKKEQIEEMRAISIHVDEVIFDNTYCHPVFDFGSREKTAQGIVEIIERNRDKKIVYICSQARGKESLLVEVAEKLQTTIVVSEQRMREIQLTGLPCHFFTTHAHQGYIHHITRQERGRVLAQVKKGPLAQSYICIDTDFLMLDYQSPDQVNYIAPYSQHSNYQQMHTFLRLIQPCIIRTVVNKFTQQAQIRMRLKIDNRLKFSKYLDFVESKMMKSETGYAKLIRQCTSLVDLSTHYVKWFDPQRQAWLMEVLELGDGQQDPQLRAKKRFMMSEEELNYRSGVSNKRKTLKDIAGGLKAANKNNTIESVFGRQRLKKDKVAFERVFRDDSNSMGSSHTEAKNKKNQCEDNDSKSTIA